MNTGRRSQSVKSMTGYAQARAERDGWVVRISLRSVNHRFLDMRLRMPDGFEAFEPQIRQLARDRLHRGHVDITLHIETARSVPVQVNRGVAIAYLHAAEELASEFRLKPEPDLMALLRLPGVVSAAGAPGAAIEEEQFAKLSAHVIACFEEALRHLDEMREAEGQSLARELHSVVARVREKTAQLETLTERSRPAYAQRLKAQLAQLLDGAPIEPARLAQEAAMLSDRADVTEELVRLRSHVEQFETLVTGAGEIGKKLDFLLQEMQREANTMLSKTPGLGDEGLAITDLGLQIKADIEKLREQVQNVE